MAKDPAALVYIDKWVAATNGMKAEFRAWYFDLMLYQFDKGPIPNDLDEIAGICRVRPSEYNLFNQMVNQVLNQKFKQNDKGEWVNSFADEVITKRKTYKEKRTKSSNIGVVVKMAKQIEGVTEPVISKLKNELYHLSLEDIEKFKNKKVLNQKVNHLVNLYINEDVIEDEDKYINKPKGGVGEKPNEASTDMEIDELRSQMQNEFSWKETICRNMKEVEVNFDMDMLDGFLDQFFKLIENDGEESKTVKDCKKHFSRWLNKEIVKIQTNEKSTNQSTGASSAFRAKTAKRLGIV